MSEVVILTERTASARRQRYDSWLDEKTAEVFRREQRAGLAGAGKFDHLTGRQMRAEKEAPGMAVRIPSAPKLAGKPEALPVRIFPTEESDSSLKIWPGTSLRITAAREMAGKPEVVPGMPALRIPEAPVSAVRPRVAAYCRVSTLLDSQATSIESQKIHYEQEIRSRAEWEYAGVYLEAGVSGTKRESRPELQRLMADCRAGEIDLILTKSISRFSRNTSDCLEMVRMLTAIGVNIYFEKENIHTGTMESEFMLSILACFAEQESRSISGNMKWSIRRKFASGSYRPAAVPYGYVDEGDRLAAAPDAAAVVQRIFRMVLTGSGANTIARTLNRDAVPSPRGKEWTASTIRKIVENPAYAGDMLWQKSFRNEQFREKRNKGELDRYYEVGHHEPIISREDFELAQAAVRQRAREVGYGKTAGCGKPAEGRGNHRYCFSGILYCEACGAVMHRQVCRGGQIRWICHRHVHEPDHCRMKPQNERDLKQAFINCRNKLIWAGNSREEDLQPLKMLTGKWHIKEEPVDFPGKQQSSSENYPDFMENQLDFPERFFSESVDYCTVDSGESVTFHFRCGLRLTESLAPVEPEESTQRHIRKTLEEQVI